MFLLYAALIVSLPFRFCFATIASIVIALRGYRKNSLNFSGAVTALLVGFVLTLANYSFFVSLLTFFVTSSFWTKWESEKKKKIEHQYKEGGQRNWVQVLCNGGFPAFVSIIYLFEVGSKEKPINYGKDFTASVLNMAIMGALACCNGDTWASEIGSVMGSQTPRLITSWRKVPVGTNGAVSLPGTIASVLGGFLIGLVHFLTIFLFCRTDDNITAYPVQWPIVVLGTLAGFFGSIIDSILGATFQYSGFDNEKQIVIEKPSSSLKHISGRNVLDNHLVNLVSSSITGILISIMGYIFWKHIY